MRTREQALLKSNVAMLFDGRGERHSNVDAGGKGERSRFRKDRVRRNSIKILSLLSAVGELGGSTSTPVAKVAAASEKSASGAAGKDDKSRFLKASVWCSSNKVLFLLTDVVEELGDRTSTSVARVVAASEKSGSEVGGKGERSRFLKDSVWRGSNNVLLLLWNVEELGDRTSTSVARGEAASEKPGSGEEEDDGVPLISG